jgi:hypothetical protein
MKSERWVGAHEDNCIQRVEGEQDGRVVGNLQHTENGQNAEPGDHDGAEKDAHRAGAALLDEEKSGQDA